MKMRSFFAIVGIAATIAGSGITLGKPAAAATRLTPAPLVGPALSRRAPSSINTNYQGALRAGKIPLVYVSDLFAGTVTAYASDTKTAPAAPLEIIAGLRFPSALAVDTKGNLYVGEQGGGGIKVFAPGSTTPFRVLAGAELTEGIAVDARGTIFAASGTGVLVYLKGATTPSYTLSDPGIASVFYLAIDRVGNVIVSYLKAGASSVGVGAFPAFTSLGPVLGVAPRLTPLGVDAASGTSNGVALDKNGDLLVSNNAPQVLNIGVYPPATQTAAFSVNTGIPSGTPNSNSVIALTGPNDRHLFVAPVSLGVLYEFAYPSGEPERRISLNGDATGHSFVTGVATYPAPPVGTW